MRKERILSVIDYRRNRYLHLVAIPLLIVLVFGVYALVYATGGIKYVYSHSMYFPIVLAGYLYGPVGGAVVGLFGSILLGPFMPIDTVTHEAQQTINWVYRSIFFISIGSLVGYGVGQLRQRMEKISFLAHYDVDTGLPNRTGTLEYISAVLDEMTDNPDAQYVLMKVACDNLMEVEVAFGFDAADSVIIQMRKRLGQALPADAFLSRTHRSEFAVVLRDLTLSDAERLSDYLTRLLEKPFSYEEIPLNVDSTIGYLSLSDNGQEDAGQLLQMTEFAVMNARQAHRNVALIDNPDRHKQNRDNLALLGQLRNAITAGELLLHYQPKLSLKSGEIVGAEALMRWQHPERGMIPPGQFIPQAEQSSIINDLTAWALHSALAQHAEWYRNGVFDDLKLAVNISANDLLASDFSRTVLNALDQYKVNHANLELEVTEGVLMEDIDRSISVLNLLSYANIIISIDDFGTGYSSLKYLDMLPASALKIDQSFTFRLASDEGSRHITEAAIGLAHSLGMKVIAEGVENLETMNMLQNMGCDIGQGYFISRPLPHDEFSEFSFQVP